MAETSLMAGEDRFGIRSENTITTEDQERKERYTNWMRTYAEATEVVVPATKKNEEQTAKLVPTPVFRYSDEEHDIPDATMWVWTHDNRPVAVQKVEGNNHGGGQKWTICFASLSEDVMSVHWPSGRVFAAQKPGLSFHPVPNAEPPADNPRARTAQIKTIKERFTARLNVEGKGGAETRTMPKPLFEYTDQDSKLPRGAIFGMTSTGTNPNLLLLIEARTSSDGKLQWEYAHARMTSSSIRFRLDDAEIWAEKEVPNGSFDNWIYYFLRRDFK